MPTASEIADALLFFIPGFVALKIFYAFGLKSNRTDLEWVVWSLLTSQLIFVLTEPVRQYFQLTPEDGLSRVAALTLSVFIGFGAVYLWDLRPVRAWRWRFIPEPWDMALLTAVDKKLQAVVQIGDGREFQGDIEWMGLSGEGASRSITLINVQVGQGDGTWLDLPLGQRIHIPEQSVLFLRLVAFEPKDDAGPTGSAVKDVPAAASVPPATGPA